MTDWNLVEACCGSSALSLHLLGSKRSLLPYQGSKWRYRMQLAAFLAEQGFEGRPSLVWLNDSGPFGRTMRILSCRAREVELELKRMSEEDPREVYDRLQRQISSSDETVFAAEHLFLQRLSVNGKAVRLRKDERWDSPGFNKNSAYGCPATDRFGEVKPMIPSLCGVLPHVAQALIMANIVNTMVDLSWWVCPIGKPTVLYVDPPYVDSTGYGGGLDRDQIVAFVDREVENADGRHLLVVVSEAKPVKELVEGRGFSSRLLAEGRRGDSPFKKTGAEWITFKTYGGSS